MLEATIKVRGTTLRFTNTHLTHNNNAERQEQADRVAELLAASRRPTVLVGDLNAEPTAPEIKTLTRYLEGHLARGRRRPRLHLRGRQPDQADRLHPPQPHDPPQVGRGPHHPGLRPPPRPGQPLPQPLTTPRTSSAPAPGPGRSPFPGNYPPGTFAIPRPRSSGPPGISRPARSPAAGSPPGLRDPRLVAGPIPRRDAAALPAWAAGGQPTPVGAATYPRLWRAPPGCTRG